MIIASCSCGAKYKVREDMLGRWATCKACGARMRLVAPGNEPPIELAPPSGLTDEAVAAANRSIEVTRGLKDAAEARFRSRPEDFGYDPGSQGSPPRATGRARRYFGDVLWSFMLLSNPHNLAVVVGVWIALVLARFATFGCFYAFIGVLLVYGWYAAFKLNIISSAANGEEDLPQLGESFSDFWEGLILPLLKYFIAFVMAALPFLLYVGYVLIRPETSGDLSMMDFLLGAVEYGDYAALWNKLDRTMIPGLIAALLGIFMWPMFLLVVTLGGIAALVRIDLMIRTIVRTFPAYLCTVILVCGIYGVEATASALFNLKAGGPSGWLLAGIAMQAIGIYLEIVAMRVIGLYYLHFKDRFAWSWG